MENFLEEVVRSQWKSTNRPGAAGKGILNRGNHSEEAQCTPEALSSVLLEHRV